MSVDVVCGSLISFLSPHTAGFTSRKFDLGSLPSFPKNQYCSLVTLDCHKTWLLHLVGLPHGLVTPWSSATSGGVM